MPDCIGRDIALFSGMPLSGANSVYSERLRRSMDRAAVGNETISNIQVNDSREVNNSR
mgnify:CR=1